jgi:hypothetical protein
VDVNSPLAEQIVDDFKLREVGVTGDALVSLGSERLRTEQNQ